MKVRIRALFVPGHKNSMWLSGFRDTPCGRGEAQFTDDPEKAMTFSSHGEAGEFWRQQSKYRPKRPDGKPNRPLTAYTVEILPVGVNSILDPK